MNDKVAVPVACGYVANSGSGENLRIATIRSARSPTNGRIHSNESGESKKDKEIARCSFYYNGGIRIGAGW